jgi:hypothetical protein
MDLVAYQVSLKSFTGPPKGPRQFTAVDRPGIYVFRAGLFGPRIPITPHNLVAIKMERDDGSPEIHGTFPIFIRPGGPSARA